MASLFSPPAKVDTFDAPANGVTITGAPKTANDLVPFTGLTAPGTYSGIATILPGANAQTTAQPTTSPNFFIGIVLVGAIAAAIYFL